MKDYGYYTAFCAERKEKTHPFFANSSYKSEFLLYNGKKGVGKCAMKKVLSFLKKEPMLVAAVLAAVAALFITPPRKELLSSIDWKTLATLFMLLSVLLALRWYREPTLRRILPLAFSIGLGMMTKLSAGTVAFAIAFLFLVAFIKTKKKGVMIGQFAVFGAVWRKAKICNFPTLRRRNMI